MGFKYLFIFPPDYVALCGSKACHRLSSESVSWCLETSLFFKTPFPGQISIPTSFVSFFVFYIFSYLLLKTMGCFSGCLMSSPAFRSCFVEFTQHLDGLLMNLWGRKWSYSSAILGPRPKHFNFSYSSGYTVHPIVVFICVSLMTMKSKCLKLLQNNIGE